MYFGEGEVGNNFPSEKTYQKLCWCT